MTRFGFVTSLWVSLSLATVPALAADPPSSTSSGKGATKATSKGGAAASVPAAEPAKRLGVSPDPDDGLESEGAQQAVHDPDGAWRKAATHEQQTEARSYFRQGNDLVKESLFVQAIASYDKALEHWDHPAIHYNLALALLNLDQPVRLRQELLASLKFGAEALGEDKAKRVEQYLKLVEAQLTEVVIRSEHVGAKVELDGKVLFTAPGEYREFVKPGTHRVKATAPGLEPTERSLVLVAGEPSDINLKLYAAEDWIRYKRRWNSPVVPIVVTASGAAIAAAGGLLFWLGASQIDDFDSDVTDQCNDVNGCDPGEVTSSPDTGKGLQVAGVAAMAGGGAVLLTGGVLLYMNRKIAYRVDPSVEEVPASKGPSVSFLPLVAPGFVGIGSRGTF